MSPSGFPLLQVIRDSGIVKVIEIPDIPLNTLLFPVVPPKLVHDGKLNVVTDKHSWKQLELEFVNKGKLNVVTDEQLLKHVESANINEGMLNVVTDEQPSKSLP